MVLGLTIALTTASCDLWTTQARGIGIRLDATPLVAGLGDTVTFNVVVSAQEVTGISIDFGDKNSDQADAGGLPTALVTFKHAYADTGSYMSRAAISDAVVGVRYVTQLITVIPQDTSTQTGDPHARMRRPSP